MPRLEYIDNSGAKAVLNLSDGLSVSIGRNPGSSIHTTNPSVSRNHGRIYQKSGDWLVKDLGSSNGTYINDDPVQQRPLEDGDLVRCGDFVLHFLNDGQAVADTRDAKKERARSGGRSRSKAAPGIKDPFSFTDAAFESALEEPSRSALPEDGPRHTLKPKNLVSTSAQMPAPKRSPRVREPARDSAREPARDSARDSAGDSARDSSRTSGRKSSRDSGRDSVRDSGRSDGRDAKRPKRETRLEVESAESAVSDSYDSDRIEIEEPVSSRSRRERREEERSRRERRDEAPSKRSESDQRLVRQIKEQAVEIEQLGVDLRESNTAVSDLESKLEDMDSRATRYEVELDSITEKYVQLKDQLTLSRERLDETREELADKEDQIFQLDSRISELDSELESARDRATGSAEATANFKIKLTQKDRQIEELQRQHDLLEFEFRAVREELHSLQEGFNADAGDTARLERKINQLREIIADKENVISALRLELENKDIEIRQVRMGMGMTDLEDEKRKLLEDYYEKNREADRLRDSQKTLQVELQEQTARLDEVQVELDRKTEAMSDITTHPDYKAKVRETVRLEGQVDDVRTELDEARERLAEFSSDEKKRLQGEVAFFKRKSTTIEDKLTRAQAKVSELEDELTDARDAVPPPAPAPVEPTEEQLADAAREATREAMAEFKAELGGHMESVYEMFVQWRSNFALLDAYLDDVKGAVDDLEGEQKATGDEAVESMTDLLRVVESDAKALKRGLKSFEKKIT